MVDDNRLVDQGTICGVKVQYDPLMGRYILTGDSQPILDEVSRCLKQYVQDALKQYLHRMNGLIV